MTRAILVLAAALALLAACVPAVRHDPRAVFDNEEVYRVFDEILEVIEARDVDTFMTRLHPEGRDGAGYREQMAQAFGYLPEGEAIETSPYYAELRRGEGEYAGIPIYLMALDVVGEDDVANLMLAIAPEQGECCVVTFISVEERSALPSTALDFMLEGRSPLHYIVLVLMFAVPAVMVATAVACVLKKDVKLKWLWIPFILVGLWGIDFNWATGATTFNLIQVGPQGVQFQLIQLNLLGVAVFKMGVLQPWIVRIGLPLGALLYWLIPARRAQRPSRRRRTFDGHCRTVTGLATILADALLAEASSRLALRRGAAHRCGGGACAGWRPDPQLRGGRRHPRR